MRSLLAPLTVLVRPRTTFANLAERPKLVWLFALLALLITLVVNVAVGMPHMLRLQDEAMREADVGIAAAETRGERTEADIEAEDAKRERAAGADEEVVVPEGVQDTVRTMTMVGSFVFGSLGVLFGTLVLAGVIYAVSRIWSKETGFGVVFGMVALAKMPDAVRNAVQAAYTAATGNWTQHQGLGALVAPERITDAPTIAYALLSMIDVYAIWFVVLLFLGMRVAMKLDRRPSFVLTGSFVAIGVLFAVVPALLAGAFMPV